jgi:hypothetical protein
MDTSKRCSPDHCVRSRGHNGAIAIKDDFRSRGFNRMYLPIQIYVLRPCFRSQGHNTRLILFTSEEFT